LASEHFRGAQLFPAIRLAPVLDIAFPFSSFNVILPFPISSLLLRGANAQHKRRRLRRPVEQAKPAERT